MSTEDKVIVKKIHKEGETKRRSNHVTYERLIGSEKYKIKGKKEEPPKPKPVREILDNYRYIETKDLRKNDPKRISIVRHKRLGDPIGKETPYEGQRYNTLTNYAPKRPTITETNTLQRSFNVNVSKNNTSINKAKNTTQTYNKTSNDAKKYSQKINTTTVDKNRQNSVNSNKGQIAQNTQIKTQNQQNQQKQSKYTLNQASEKNSLNQTKPQQNQQTQKYQINQKTTKYSKNYQSSTYQPTNINAKNAQYNQINATKNMNQYQKKQEISSMNEKTQMNQYQNQQKNMFNSPEQQKYGMEEKYSSKTEKLIICRTCGKPKRPRNAQSTEKTLKTFTREIIGEEKAADDYVIRYGNENDNIQSQQRFETYRAPGTHFCPVHGYV